MIRLATNGTRIPVGAIVTDLDRTLTDRRLRVHDDTIRALRSVRRRGVRLVLATGRAMHEMRRRRRILDVFDAVILEGGGLVGTPHHLRPLNPAVHHLERLREWLRTETIEYRFGATALSLPRTALRRLRTYPRFPELHAEANRDRLDVTLRGVNKGAGLRALRRRELQGMTGRILAFGDGENDLPLLRAAHYRVAVANAVPALLHLAHEATVDYGGRGVTRFLHERLLEQGVPPARADT